MLDQPVHEPPLGPSAICRMFPDAGVLYCKQQQPPRSVGRDRFDVQQIHTRRFRATGEFGRPLRAHSSLAAPDPPWKIDVPRHSRSCVTFVHVSYLQLRDAPTNVIIITFPGMIITMKPLNSYDNRS